MRAQRFFKFLIWVCVFFFFVLLIYFNPEEIKVRFFRYSLQLPLGVGLFATIILTGFIVYILMSIKLISGMWRFSRIKKNLIKKLDEIKDLLFSLFYLGEGQTGQAEKIVNRLKELNSDEAIIVRSIIMCNKGRHEESLKILRDYFNSRESSSLSPLLYSRLIEEYLHSNLLSEAYEFYKSMVPDKFKNNFFIKKSMRDTFLSRGDLNSALSLQKEIWSEDKNNQKQRLLYVQILTELAIKEFKRGQRKIAEKLLEDALDIYPSFIPSIDFLGEIYFLEGEISKCVKIWKEGFAKTGNSLFLTRIMDAYLKSNMPEELLEFSKNLNHFFSSPATQLFTIKVYLRMGMSDEASRELDSLDLSKFKGEWEHELNRIRVRVALAHENAKKVMETVRELEREWDSREENFYRCNNCHFTFSRWSLICEKCSSVGKVFAEHERG